MKGRKLEKEQEGGSVAVHNPSDAPGFYAPGRQTYKQTEAMNVRVIRYPVEVPR